MARRLIVWSSVSGTLVALLIFGLGTMVTQRLARFHARAGGEGARAQLETRRLRAEAALGDARARLAVTRHRLSIATLLDRTTDPTTLAIEVDADEWRDSARRALLTGAIRAEWEDLGLDVTKVAVGVVVLDRATVRDWARGLFLPPGDPVAYYVLPDSLAPATCVAMVVAPPARTRDPGELRAMAASWFGACGYYARFGIPAPRVRAWLEARGLDVVRTADWSPVEGRHLSVTGPAAGTPDREWYWWGLYMMPSQAAGCLAGRVASCRSALAFGDSEASVVRGNLIPQLDNQWRLDRQHLVGGDRFLGAVVREVGARRFQEFWRTSLPVDSALTVALHQPVGEWTATWEASVAPPPHFGPGARWNELLIALLLIAGAVAVVGKNVLLREVR